jgi:hypothetical protein
MDVSDSWSWLSDYCYCPSTYSTFDEPWIHFQLHVRVHRLIKDKVYEGGFYFKRENQALGNVNIPDSRPIFSANFLGTVALSVYLIKHLTMITWSRGSSNGIATGSTAGVQIPARANFFSSPQRPDRLWGPPSVLSNGYGGHFPRG